MHRLFAASALCLVLASPTLADGKIYVQLPDLSGLQGTKAETLLTEVVLANVISSNCADYAVTDEDWSLLTGSADILARGQLGLSIDDYDSRFYGPAFAALDERDACATHGPQVLPVLERLVDLGGSREPLPDQDKAYEEEQARQAAWDAATEQPRKQKTK